MDTLKKLPVRLKAFAQRQHGRRWVKLARAAFILGVAAWLAYQLAGIGWGEVWASRPRTPWFYVLWVGLYLQLPLVEAFIYRAVWGLPLREGLWPILRKRALNQDVVSYSGEAYFFVWARRHLPLSGRRIGGTLKDNAIASSLGSWAAAVLLIGGFLFSGQIVLADLVGDEGLLYLAAGTVLAGAVLALGIRFRRTLFTLPPRTVLRLFGVHVGRFVLLAYVLQIAQWWVVVPEAPLSVWATMLAVMTLINRIPLIPAKDLVGIGAVLGMAGLLEAAAATIAAMLLMRSALDKLANLGLFVAASLWEHRRGNGRAVPPPGGDVPEHHQPPPAVPAEADS